MIVGIGALRTRHVLEAAEDAQSAGAAGVLLAPVSYQPLTDDEVFGLFEDVTAGLSVPLVVYDNPRTTRFTSPTSCTRGLAGSPAWLPSRSPSTAGPCVSSRQQPPTSASPRPAASRFPSAASTRRNARGSPR
ncbi:hypothetical protein ABZ817_12070 [Streptomyces antimycoticus]|uniref:dihydrodipicolinate synthase family protein n=1 Tax=Streptomyces antimycoticus TaxID=68175 RepID=UPI0033FD3421